MGFKQIDVVPINSNGPTCTVPGNKENREQLFQVSRADTVATLKAVVPADASIMTLIFFAGVSSNASITGTVTLTVSNNTGVISTGVVDVKVNGSTTALVQMSNLPNLENIPLQGDLSVKAVYAETGVASTVGGPWTVGVRFAR